MYIEEYSNTSMCRTNFNLAPFDSREILIVRVFMNKNIQISTRCTCSANFADLARNKITCQTRKTEIWLACSFIRLIFDPFMAQPVQK